MDAAASKGGRRALIGFYGMLVVFLYAPLVILMIFSFNDSRVIAFPLQGFTTRWYRLLATNDQLLGSLRLSALVAAVTSVIAVGLGVLASLVLVRRRFAGKSLVGGLFLSPLVIPYIVFGIALLILFSAVNEVLASWFGVLIEPGFHSIVIGHVVVSLPYTILTIVPRLERLDVSMEEAARDLGASPGGTFWRVTLPLLAPAIVSALLIAFTLSFDEYAIASFVAGESSTYPIFLYGQLRLGVGLPQMIAISVIVLTVSMILVVSTETIRRRGEQRLEGARA